MTVWGGGVGVVGVLLSAADLPPRNLERLEKEKLEECLALAAPACCCPTGILEEKEEGIIGGGVLATARVAAITPRAIGPGRGGGGGGGAGGAGRPPAVAPSESATGASISLPAAIKKSAGKRFGNSESTSHRRGS